jgi:hypothetical protein
MRWPALADKRLIYVAASPGVSGIGDYSEEFLESISTAFGEVHTYRHGPPGDAGVRDIHRDRAELNALVTSGPPSSTILHFEFSGGALVPYWTSLGHRDVRVTATVHDAPWPVWWPLRTKLVARSQLSHHAVHYPFQLGHGWLQRRAMRNRTLFVLTAAGATETARRMKYSEIVEARHHVPERNQIKAAENRPAAIGLFGHVYRGKGFDQLANLRRLIDPGVKIRVAGRGTESLGPVEGVEILGGVDGQAEDEFFESIRVMMLPYDKRSRYGQVLPASGVLMRSIAYRTPVVCSGYGALADLEAETGILGVRGGFEGLAAEAGELVTDRSRLSQMGLGIDSLARSHTIEKTSEIFLEEWSRQR